jgi:hypothetical protein
VGPVGGSAARIGRGQANTLGTRTKPLPLAPWYQTKAAPSMAGMLAKLPRVLIAAQYRQGQLPAPTPLEILEVQAAWAAAGA